MFSWQIACINKIFMEIGKMKRLSNVNHFFNNAVFNPVRSSGSCEFLTISLIERTTLFQ
ncbi:hypothetical protein JT162_03385 [Helicobacter pylori]|nr:hypothetical protein [Helicobacter pylori]